MLKNLFLTSFFFVGLISSVYPTEKENTNLFDYCFSLEKILVRNSFESRKNISGEIKTLSKAIASIGMNNSRGDLTRKIIDKYKSSEDSVLISFVPTKIYCLSGYWAEKISTGNFESIVYESSKEVVEEFYNEYEKYFHNDLNDLINDFNKQYKMIKKEFNGILN